MISIFRLYVRPFINLLPQHAEGPPTMHALAYLSRNSRHFFVELCSSVPYFLFFLKFQTFFLWNTVPCSALFHYFSEFWTNFVERCSSIVALFTYLSRNSRLLWNAVPQCLISLFFLEFRTNFATTTSVQFTQVHTCTNAIHRFLSVY